MKKSLVKNSIYNIIYKVVTALYPLIAVTYVSHILMAERMGLVSYAQNIVSYFVVFAALGIPTYGIREIAINANDKEERSIAFWELFSINMISTSIALITYAAIVRSIPKFSENLELYIIAGLQIAFNYLNVDWFYQGMEEYKYISIRSIVVKIIALISLPLLVKTSDDYINYALIYCLAIAGNNIFNIIRIRKYIIFHKFRLDLKRHLKPIAVLWIVSIAVELYAMIDTTMLGIFCNDEIVGCYSNAMKLTRMVNTIAASIGSVLFPRLSVIFTQQNIEKFNTLVNKGIKIMLVIAIPASVGLILLSEDIILVLFGTSFLPAVPILRILSLMVPVVVCNTLMGGQVLVTTNQENKYVFTVIIASTVNITLNTLFIPKYGPTSAAIASLVSEIIDLILYCWFAKKYVQIKITWKYIFSLFTPLLIYILIFIKYISKMSLNSTSNIVVNIILCIIIYFGLGYLMKNESIVFIIKKTLKNVN